MDKVTLERKSVEEAVIEGLELLEAKREDVIVHVVDEGQKAFLGLIGGKNAVVVIARKGTPDADGLVDNELLTKPDSSIVEESVELNKINEEALDIKNLNLDNKDDEKIEIGDVLGNEIISPNLDRDHFKKFDNKDDAAEDARVFLEEMMYKMGYSGVVEVIPPHEEGENYVLDMIPDDYKMNSRFIGKKGDTLSSIGYLVNVYLRNHFDGDMMIEVDCGDYLYEKQEDLKSFARMAASRAKNEGIYKMRPMTAYDRRIVHNEIGKIDGVSTHSEGEEPRRRIIVTRDPQ